MKNRGDLPANSIFNNGPKRTEVNIGLLVAQGKQDEVEHLLANSDTETVQGWLSNSSVFTDYSDRRFECKPFDYAFWAADMRMCWMLINYMNEETKSKVLQSVRSIIEHGLQHFDKNGVQQCSHDYGIDSSIQAYAKLIPYSNLDMNQFIINKEEQTRIFYKNLNTKPGEKQVMNQNPPVHSSELDLDEFLFKEEEKLQIFLEKLETIYKEIQVVNQNLPAHMIRELCHPYNTIRGDLTLIEMDAKMPETLCNGPDTLSIGEETIDSSECKKIGLRKIYHYLKHPISNKYLLMPAEVYYIDKKTGNPYISHAYFTDTGKGTPGGSVNACTNPRKIVALSYKRMLKIEEELPKKMRELRKLLGDVEMTQEEQQVTMKKREDETPVRNNDEITEGDYVVIGRIR